MIRVAARRGFTLIELLVAIAVSIILVGVVTLSLAAALDSWRYTRDELALQQVMSGVLEEMLEGTDWRPGLRSALEVSGAQDTQVSIVPPWTEEHSMTGGRESVALAQYVRPGTGLPTAELRLPGTTPFVPIPVSWEDSERVSDRPRIRPAFDIVSGSTLRVSYHPDPTRSPEALVTFRWDPEQGVVMREQATGAAPLGQNAFGVTISDCRFRYYDQTNTVLAESGGVAADDAPLITAVEVEMTGRVGAHALTLRGMMMLRNSMRQSGLLVLHEGLRISVPDSHAIKTLLVTNLTGIRHDDELQLEVRPPAGRSWRVTMRFERYGQAAPVIGQVTVEYPPGHPVWTDRPRTSADQGLDCLTLGPNGLYDYDDDSDVEDVVLVEGEPAILTVTKMDIQGAACFVQP